MGPVAGIKVVEIAGLGPAPMPGENSGEILANRNYSEQRINELKDNQTI